MRNGISSVLIVKDGEKTLDRCLKSIADVDEIIVLVNQSMDKTAEIARSHTSKVYVVPDTAVMAPTETGELKFHFAQARNLAMSYAKQDWILTIDADEIAHPGCVNLIRKAFFRHPGANIFDVRFIVSNEGGKDPASLPKPKVFRKGRFEWQNRIHELLVPKHGHAANGQYLEDAVMEHLPLEGADKEARREQNLELLKLSVKEEPAYVRNCRQLGMEYFAREQYRDALPWLELYVKSGAGGPLDHSETLLHMARCHSGIGVLDEALKYFNRSIEAYPTRREPFYFKGLALVKEARTVQDLERAVEVFKKCLEIPENLKPDFHLNIQNCWDGTYPKEALEFCENQIAEANRKLEEMKKASGEV